VSVAVKQIMPDHVLARQEKGGLALHRVKLSRDKIAMDRNHNFSSEYMMQVSECRDCAVEIMVAMGDG
jgi:hypothetical protein